MGRRSGEVQETMPPIDLKIRTTLEQIPDPPECCVCRQTMTKVRLNYKFDHNPVFSVAEIPGYSCPDCGEERVSESALHEVHKLVLTFLKSLKNDRSPIWQRRVNAYQKIVTAEQRLLQQAGFR